MMTEFFQLGNLPSDQYIGSYSIGLAILSFLVAVAASYIALDMTARLRDISNTPSTTLVWLLGGAIAMGSGIWSMHFIGMLSFTIPGLSLRYDLFWTVFSLVVAIFASAFALFLLQSNRVRLEHYIAGGVILGLGIASMHYTGMEAMLITLDIRYLPLLFFISILIAIVASEAALWLALKSNQTIARLRNRIKLGSAIIMGVAICGMHYTGMAASVFSPLCTASVETSATALDPTLLAIGVASVTFIILGIAFFASNYKEAMNYQKFEQARQLGMAEIAANVLHSVGNVLNSVNVSTNILLETVSKSKLSDLEKLANLFEEKKENLVQFITQDEKGLKSLAYIKVLADYWQQEKTSIHSELSRLADNVLLIQNIVSTQQSLSKTNQLEEIVSINELLNEAMLITDIKSKNQIIINKHYGSLKPIEIDKVKLLQVFVNIFQNAKDSLLSTSRENKIIAVTTSYTNGLYKIEISDNGAGILEKNLKRIFNYGFTTKNTGHGFGLHGSAIAVNLLGGKIEAISDGVDKGATFIIELKRGF